MRTCPAGAGPHVRPARPRRSPRRAPSRATSSRVPGPATPARVPSHRVPLRSALGPRVPGTPRRRPCDRPGGPALTPPAAGPRPRAGHIPASAPAHDGRTGTIDRPGLARPGCVRGHVRTAPSPTFTTARPLCPPPRGAGCPQSCPRLGTTAEVLPRAPGRVVHCPPALEDASLLTSTDTRSRPRRRQHRDAPPGTCTYESTLTTKRVEPRDRRPPVPEEGVGRLFTPVHTPVDDGGRPGSLLWTDPVLAVDAGARSAAGPPASTPGTGSGTAARTPCFVT